MSHPERALTTALAIVLNYAFTALFGLLAVGALVGGVTATQADNDGLFEGLGDAIGAVLFVAAAVLAGLLTWGVVLGINLSRRRTWARTSAIATYFIYTAFMVFNAVAQISSDGGQPGVAAVLGAGYLSVSLLLLAPPTAREFSAPTASSVGPYAQVLAPGDYKP